MRHESSTYCSRDTVEDVFHSALLALDNNQKIIVELHPGKYFTHVVRVETKMKD